MNLKKVMKALHTWELEAASAGREEEMEHLSRFVRKQIMRIEKKKAMKKAPALSFTPQDV